MNIWSNKNEFITDDGSVEQMKQRINWKMNCSLSNKLVRLIAIKGIVHFKKKKLLLFIHPQVVSNMYTFLSSAEHKIRYSEECL